MTYKELETYLKERNVSKMDFCRETSISPQILTNAKNRGGHFSATTMQKMESFLNKDKMSEDLLTDQEIELIKHFRNLDDTMKRQIVLMAAYWKEHGEDLK